MNIYLKPKIFRALKLSTLCLILGVEAGFATESYSQKTTFTISVQDQSVKEVFDYIEQHSEFIIFYLDETIDVNRKVSVNLKDQRVESILEQLFKNTDVMYTINDRQILLSKRKEMTEVAPVVAVVQQKKNTVKGKVLDENGVALPGATIIVKGSTRGVTTDIDGSYDIEVADNEILVYSFLGMQDQEVKVGNQKIIVVRLKEQTDELEEVTVVAFGKQKKSSVIGSISTITADELKVPVAKISTSLAGQLAGIVAVQRSGEPGAGADFWIRGVSSFGANTTPLVLVDGVERSMDLVDPEDIASFSILKDATATALYGVRGANGIVLITTKRGKEAPPTVNARVEYGVSQPIRMPKLASASQWMGYYNDSSFGFRFHAV